MSDETPNKKPAARGGARAGAGRPAVGPYRHLRLPDELWQWAGSHGMPASTYIRQLLERDRGKVPEPPQPE